MWELAKGVIIGAGAFLIAVWALIALIEICVIWDTYVRVRRHRKAQKDHTIELIRRGR